MWLLENSTFHKMKSGELEVCTLYHKIPDFPIFYVKSMFILKLPLAKLSKEKLKFVSILTLHTIAESLFLYFILPYKTPDKPFVARYCFTCRTSLTFYCFVVQPLTVVHVAPRPFLSKRLGRCKVVIVSVKVSKTHRITLHVQ